MATVLRSNENYFLDVQGRGRIVGSPAPTKRWENVPHLDCVHEGTRANGLVYKVRARFL